MPDDLMPLRPGVLVVACMQRAAARRVKCASRRSPAVDADRRAIRSAACSVQDASSGSATLAGPRLTADHLTPRTTPRDRVQGIGLPDRTSAHAAVEGRADLAQPCGSSTLCTGANRFTV